MAYMKRFRPAAAADGITLFPLSGFRSIARQTRIIRSNLAAGRDPADLFRAGQIIEEKLMDLPKPDEIPKGTDGLAAEGMIRKWQRDGANVVELSERHRDTAKKAVKAACEKGNIPPGPASMCLLFELGLVEGA